ncbi:MAG: hypothetical protein FWC17_01945 [Treponema sp.]|nr:hypothetical protein [Treponema sp.]
MILALTLYMQEGGGFSVKVIFTAPGVLYILMALFILIDSKRYSVYLPLFIAGKFTGIFMLLGWSIITRQVTMIESFVLSVDFFSLAAVLMIRRNLKIQTARAASILNTVQISSPQIAPELEDK